MDQQKVKDHLKITGIIAAIVFIGFSYIVGSFNHSVATEDDRGMALIIFALAAIIVNMMYYESYTEKKKEIKNKENENW